MHRTKLVAWVFLIVLAAGACVPIQAPEVAQPAEVESDGVSQPEPVVMNSRDDVPRITPEDAKAHFDSGTAVFVDARDEGDFEYSGIAGALNSPYDTVFMPQAAIDEAIAELQKQVSPEQLIITYCT